MNDNKKSSVTTGSNTQDKIVQDIINDQVDPSNIILDLAATTELHVKAAEQRKVETVIEDIDVTFKDTMKEILEPKTIDESVNSIQDKLDRMRDSKESNMVSDIIITGVEFIFTFLKDFFLTGEYAKITGERTRLQILREDIRPLLLDSQSALEYYKRFPEYEVELKSTLSKTGYRDTDINRLKALNEYIPVPQDIILFMVREVYRPDIVKLLDMDAGFSLAYPDAKKDADRQGVSEDTLKKYWRAHWRLPGINQGFEMLHRGELDLDGLRRLLKISDIMPGYIEPLIAISYNPYTRVDVRRMHKLGVLTDDDLITAYKDLGYDDEKANGMKEFTIKYNADPDAIDQNDKDKRRVRERDLTKSDIISVYKYKAITRSDAGKMLQAIGYDDDEAELYLQREDIKAEIDVLNLQEKRIKKAYVSSLWDRAKTSNELDKLNLPSGYRTVVLEKWDIERELKTEIPTKSEVLSFYRSGIISENKARDMLELHGYNHEYIKWYIKSIQGKINADKTK